MADAADIQTVLDAIEDDYTEHGWTETMIGDRLDAGALPERVIAVYWSKRATKALLLVNTSESGSSRGNDSIYPRLKKLADEWEARAEVAEAPVVPVETRGRLSSFPIRRV